MKKLSSFVVPLLLIILLVFNTWAYYSLSGLLRNNKQTSPVSPYLITRQIFIFDQAHQFPQGGILLLGDSITDGLWFTAVDGIPVLNAGMGGARIDTVVKYLPELVEITRPRVVVVTIGINDIVGMMSSDSKEKEEQYWAKKYEALIDGVLATGAIPVPSTILPIRREARLEPLTELVLTLNKEIVRIAKEKDLVLCDGHAALAAPDGFMGTTGMKNDLHPSTASYLKWHTVLENSIRLALERANSQATGSAQ